MSNPLKHIGPKGSGYFCDVIQYRNEMTNTDYAQKILKKEHYPNDKYRYRLLREMKLLRDLEGCEYIIDLINSGNDKDSEKLWYLMPCADNNLFKYIKKNNGKLTTLDRFNIADQVIGAIKYAHSLQVLHRDISPNNVLVFENGAAPNIKVSDFGLGKDKESLSYYTGSSASGYGQILYVAPEQREKLKDATAQSDIYSLGKLIYFIFTGKDPDNLKSFDLSSLVSKATEENPQDRFTEISEFENYYLRLKELNQNPEIPIEYQTLLDFKHHGDTINWLNFHLLAVQGNYFDHVYYDYLEPVISVLNKDNNISNYYAEVGADFNSFILTFSDRLDECYGTVRWPFSAMNTFGKFLANIIRHVDDEKVRLICFKQLWSIAFGSDQWAAQATLKTVFNKRYISETIQISLADYIQKEAIKVDMSHFSGIDLPKVVKVGIVQSNEAFKEAELERLRIHKEEFNL